MDQETFVQRIKLSLRDLGIKSLLRLFTQPSGRKPRDKIREISNWYNDLQEEEKRKVELLIGETIDFTLFSFFCILDQVRFLDNEEEKTKFNLYADKNGQSVLLNDPEKEELHNIYNSLTQDT